MVPSPSQVCQQPPGPETTPPQYSATGWELVKSRESVEKWLCTLCFLSPTPCTPHLSWASSPALQRSPGCLTSLSPWHKAHLVSISKNKQLPGAAGWTDLVTKCSKSIIALSLFKYAPFCYLRCQFSYMEKAEIIYMGALTTCYEVRGYHIG